MSAKSKLVKRRDLIFAHLNRSKTFLRGFDAASQQQLVSVRLEKLEGKWEDFEQIQLEIE